MFLKNLFVLNTYWKINLQKVKKIKKLFSKAPLYWNFFKKDLFNLVFHFFQYF